MTEHGSEKDYLDRLNRQFGDMEQRRDDEALQFFRRHLSDCLVFRRANKSVAGKRAFLEGLTKSDPFSSRESENVKVRVLNDRAVASLIVVATDRNDGSTRSFRNIRFFTREDGIWRVDSWFNFIEVDASL